MYAVPFKVIVLPMDCGSAERVWAEMAWLLLLSQRTAFHHRWR